MKDIGQFFGQVVVVVGFLQLTVGTIGLIVWSREEYVAGLVFLAALISNLLVSSLFISCGAYISLRLNQIPDSTKKSPLAVGVVGTGDGEDALKVS